MLRPDSQFKAGNPFAQQGRGVPAGTRPSHVLRQVPRQLRQGAFVLGFRRALRSFFGKLFGRAHLPHPTGQSRQPGQLLKPTSVYSRFQAPKETPKQKEPEPFALFGKRPFTPFPHSPASFSRRAIPLVISALFLIIAAAAYLTLTHSASSQATWKDTSWPYRKKLVIDPHKVSGTTGLSNFPVLFSKTDADLRSAASGGKVGRMSGKDIFFTDWEGNKLAHEIETYASSTGQLIAWVKVPFVSSTSTRELFMYYGNASATDQSNKTGVWDTNYKGVWHLSDAANSTSTESTTNANDGANTGLTSASGKIGNSGSFNGTSSYVNVADNTSLNPTSAVTMSAWVKTSTADKYIMAKDPPDSSPSPFSFAKALATAAGRGLRGEGLDSSFGPAITNTYTDPYDVAPGDKLLVSADVSDPTGIRSVIAEMPYEGGSDILQMNLIKGTIYNGTWQGTWTAHDTLDKGYTTTVTAQNAQGTGSQSQIYWTDTGGSCTTTNGVVTLDFPSYSATVNATSSVTVSLSGFSGTCTVSLRDNTSGSYVIIPTSSDPELDCNGTVCSAATLVGMTRALKCDSAGTYNIIGYVIGTITPDKSSSVSTFACNPAGKSQVPYALSTVGGGQFLIMATSTPYTATSSVSVTDGNWHYMSATYDSTTMKIYVDGALTGTSTSFSGALPVQAGALHIGADYQASPGNLFNGQIDEPRLASTARSADWIKTEYNNQSSPESFFAMSGTEQQQHPTGSSASVKLGPQGTPALAFKDSSWPYRKKITIDPKKVSGATGLSNFPVLFSKTDPDLRSTASGGKVGRMSGKDIFFTDWEGNKLSHEIETYASSTGQLVAWVKVPFLSSTSTRELYMYYGNASAANQQDVANVWGADYKGVWHLGETSGNFLDSTSNNNIGTPQAAVTRNSGTKIDGGATFDGSQPNSSYISVTNNSSLQPASAVTLEAWVYPTAATNDASIVSNDAWHTNGYEIWQSASGSQVGWHMILDYSGNTISAYSNANYSLNTWSHVVGTYTKSEGIARIYVNGSLVTSSAVDTNGLVTPTNNLWIGAIAFLPGTRATTGSQDEVRISDSARSADWIKTEYNNQSNPGTFAAFGNEQSQTRTPSGASQPAPLMKARGGVKFR